MSRRRENARFPSSHRHVRPCAVTGPACSFANRPLVASWRPDTRNHRKARPTAGIDSVLVSGVSSGPGAVMRSSVASHHPSPGVANRLSQLASEVKCAGWWGTAELSCNPACIALVMLPADSYRTLLHTGPGASCLRRVRTRPPRGATPSGACDRKPPPIEGRPAREASRPAATT